MHKLDRNSTHNSNCASNSNLSSQRDGCKTRNMFKTLPTNKLQFFPALVTQSTTECSLLMTIVRDQPLTSSARPPRDEPQTAN